MSADIIALTDGGSLFFQVGCLFEEAVAFSFQFFSPLIVGFLVVPLNGGIAIVGTVGFSSHHIMTHTGEEPHIAVGIAWFGGLVLVYFFVRFHGLVHKCLCLGLKE